VDLGGAVAAMAAEGADRGELPRLRPAGDGLGVDAEQGGDFGGGHQLGDVGLLHGVLHRLVVAGTGRRGRGDLSGVGADGGRAGAAVPGRVAAVVRWVEEITGLEIGRAHV